MLAKSKKAYIVDFKVRFKTHYTAWLGGGLTMGDFLSAAGQDHSNARFKSVSVKEKKAIHAFIKPDAAFYQKVTDQVYADFVKRMKDSGFEVIPREQLTYEDIKTIISSKRFVRVATTNSFRSN